MELYVEVVKSGYVEICRLYFRDMSNQFREIVNDNVLMGILESMKTGG